MKYQPYQGYHHKPWIAYGHGCFPARVRARGDWRYNSDPRGYHTITHEVRVTWQGGTGQRVTRRSDPALCRRCGHVHCPWCPCDRAWQRHSRPAKVRYLKARARGHSP